MNRLLNLANAVSEALGDSCGWMKAVFLAAITTIGNFYLPIVNYLYAIAAWATFDIFAGILADHGRWDKWKFLRAFLFLAIYLILILMAYWTGIMMKESEDSIRAFSSWISWVMIYYYIANTLRNLNNRFPESKTIAFLYWIVTVKFISKINFLEDFNRSRQTKDTAP